jgi:uncharacterized protein
VTSRRTPRETARCPTCGAAVAAKGPHRPFCSPRCKMVDLGRWFREDYAIPGEDAVSFEGLEGRAGAAGTNDEPGA